MAHTSKKVVKDRGWKELFATAKRLARDKPYVKVGFLASKTDEEVITVAASNEFGVPAKNVPERSFVRSTFDLKQREMYELLRQLVGGIYDGKMTANRALGIAGSKLAAEIKLHVTQGPGVPPPNAPATIEKKLGLDKFKGRALARAAKGVDKKAGIAAALFGSGGDASAIASARGVAVFGAQAKALARVRVRLQQARLAAHVFGSSGVRTLVDTGRMLNSLTWQVVSGREER